MTYVILTKNISAFFIVFHCQNVSAYTTDNESIALVTKSNIILADDEALL